jgi:inner membrane protein
MPSIFTHAIFATSVGKAFAPERLPMRFWVLTAICAMLPDIDALGLMFGVRYGSMFGHRGITHSITFALLVGMVVGYFFFRRSVMMIYFTLVTLSHPLLDAMTNGGSGVALFAPFSTSRYFAPWRPIQVSPIGLRFFSERGLEVLASEIVWVWIPAFLVLLVASAYRKFTRVVSEAG